MQVASKAIEWLHTFQAKRKDGTPFFLAAGFRRPHLPFLCPKKFYDLYPPEEIRLPDNPYAPVGMPEIAWADSAELRQYRDMRNGKWYGAINDTLPDKVTLALRRAYYACTSYTDSLVGEIIAALTLLGFWNNTIVAFWGDHGWQLGEHAEWSKSSNFELATHAPMMVRVPGLTDNGVVTERLTEFVDLFPTLVEAAGLPAIPLCPENSGNVSVCTEGVSFLPLMKKPSLPWKQAVFSQYPRMYIGGGVIMGYSMRTERYRYAEWMAYDGPRFKPLWGDVLMSSVELYDQEAETKENYNLAFHANYSGIRKRLSSQLRQGWRKALPPFIYPRVDTLH